MTPPRFFGYGSLVNLATHDFADPRPTRLAGWRRVWRHTALRPAAFLSVEPAKGAEIDGITAGVPGADWTALDAREYAYARRDVTADVTPAQGQTAVYEVKACHLAAPQIAHPILLSYLDCVVQGFLRVHGPAGAAQFFATTAGWDAPILNDRAAPRYPRAQNLTAAETATVDEALVALGVRVISAKA